MANASIMLVILAIAFLLLAVFFIAGLIFLIVGIVNKCRAKNKGKKFPVVLIVIGALLLLLPVGTTAAIITNGLTASISKNIMRSDYENVTDKWRNEWISDHSAAEEAIEELLSSADSGERERFARIFTPNIQRSENFGGYLDAFFDTYPVGLSDCRLDGGNVQSSSSYNYGHNVQEGETFYTCVSDGEWYCIRMAFCYENTDSPNDVGVTFFSVENLEADALDVDYKDIPLVCNIKSEQEVSARLIGDMAFLFTPTPQRVITQEQLKKYLEEYDNLGALIKEIGEPNVTKKYSNCTGYDHYYELAPENGEPRYAYLCTDSQTGRFLSSYICSDTESYYDESVLPEE